MRTILLFAVLLIRTVRFELPCPSETWTSGYSCGMFHWHTRTDTSVVSMEYIQKHYEHPDFNMDSTVCWVTEGGFE
jgi:hypothetical protein